MKKSMLIAVLGVATSLASYGQGVLFNNYNGSTQLTGVKFGNGPLSGQYVGSAFTATLYYGANGTADTSLLQAVGAPVTFSTSVGYPAISGGGALGSGAGWFDGSLRTLPAYNTTYAMAYFVTGTYLGVTYSGWSPIVNVLDQASSGSPVPQLPNSLRLVTFNVSSPVPEPTTLALAGLGGLASLVMLRRKKA